MQQIALFNASNRTPIKVGRIVCSDTLREQCPEAFFRVFNDSVNFYRTYPLRIGTGSAGESGRLEKARLFAFGGSAKAPGKSQFIPDLG